jgi:UDP-N-acetylmuramoylalanine--D-glutamate ligase
MQLNKHNEAIALDFKNKCVGIWGYGITGSAAVDYFQSKNTQQIIVFDEKQLAPEINHTLSEKNIIIYRPDQRNDFLDTADYILKSPGIPCTDLPSRYKKKIVSEFDIFASTWNGPIIAITGTVGKTTVTSLLSQLLHATHKPVLTGGNIGIPMLSLLTIQPPSHYAVIELSSFQTEFGITVPPDLAIITNLHPNHLDRHGSMEMYREAKLELIRLQKSHQKALLPLSCSSFIQRPSPKHSYAWFSATNPSAGDKKHCMEQDTWYYGEGDHILREHNHQKIAIGRRKPTTTTFFENILILTSAFDMLGESLEHAAWDALTIPPHRLTPIAIYQTITFYNDSKSTIPVATLAAIEQLSPHKPVVFLGGISKGVDRQPFIQQLTERVRLAICFGSEATQLAKWCEAYNIPVHAHATLEIAYQHYIDYYCAAGDHVLFSPAGASYDLFENYIKRGERFVQLVKNTLSQTSLEQT